MLPPPQTFSQEGGGGGGGGHQKPLDRSGFVHVALPPLPLGTPAALSVGQLAKATAKHTADGLAMSCT